VRKTKKQKTENSQKKLRVFCFCFALFRSIALASASLVFKTCRETAKFGAFCGFAERGKKFSSDFLCR
jgi:hypothetical protein